MSQLTSPAPSAVLVPSLHYPHSIINPFGMASPLASPASQIPLVPAGIFPSSSITAPLAVYPIQPTLVANLGCQRCQLLDAELRAATCRATDLKQMNETLLVMVKLLQSERLADCAAMDDSSRTALQHEGADDDEDSALELYELRRWRKLLMERESRSLIERFEVVLQSEQQLRRDLIALRSERACSDSKCGVKM
jgi:hypothetical protein